MANNVVGVEIVGRDSTSAAMRSAAANMERMRAGAMTATKQAALMQNQMRGLGQVIQSTGNVASIFGQQHIAAAANHIAVITMAGREATQAFTAMNSVLKRTVAGLAIAGAAWGVSKWMEAREAVEQAAESTKRLTEFTRESVVATMGLVNATKAAQMAEDLRHLKAMEFIGEQLEAKGDLAAYDAALKQEEERHQWEMHAIRQRVWKEQMDTRAALDEAANQGEIERFIDMMDTQNVAAYNAMEGRKEFLKQYEAFWIESHRTMASYAAEGLRTVTEGLSGAIVDVAMRTRDATKAFQDLAKGIARMFAQFIVNRTLAFVAEKVMSAIGLGMAKAQALAIAPIAAGVAASWAPAATAALIGTYGLAASASALLPAAMAANQAVAHSMAMSGGLLGQAHSGMDYVPREGSYILQKGEMVLDPGTSKELRDAATGGSGGTTTHRIQLHLGDRQLGELLLQMSRDGRLRISQKALV